MNWRLPALPVGEMRSGIRSRGIARWSYAVVSVLPLPYETQYRPLLLARSVSASLWHPWDISGLRCSQVYVWGMDTETQRLLITALISASAAIIGGLGGAVFTARTNRANTKDTLDQAELMDARKNLAAQEAEHEVWKRNERMRVYSEFFAAVLNEQKQVSVMHKGRDDQFRSNLGAVLAPLEIVGSEPVRRIARRFTEHIQLAHTTGSSFLWDMRATGIAGEEQERRRHIYNAVAEQLGKLMDDYVRAVREDLDAASPEDTPWSSTPSGVDISAGPGHG